MPRPPFPHPGRRAVRLLAGLLALVGCGEAVTGPASPRLEPSPQPVAQTAAAGPVVARVTLVDADRDVAIATHDPLEDGDTLNLATLPSRRLNVIAHTEPTPTGSVRFALDANANFRTESVAPYLMAGDQNGGKDYLPWTPTVGEHVLRVTAYSGGSASGTAGAAVTIRFTVIDAPPPPPPPAGPRLAKLVLVDADRDVPIAEYDPFADGDTLNLATLPSRRLNVIAVPAPDPAVRSVRFALDANANFRTESTAPFLLAGDQNGGTDYLPWTPTVGTHVLKVTPYSATAAGGTAGASVTVTFTVTDAATPPPPASGLRIGRVALVNADADAPVAGFDPLADGAVLDLATLPTRRLSVRAYPASDSVRSVRFSLNGVVSYRTETGAPYLLAGDVGGTDYRPWTPNVGQHVLVITPYAGTSGTGTRGDSVVIRFRVADGPVPAGDSVHLVLFGDSNTDTGYEGTAGTRRVRSYVSHHPIRLLPTAPDDPFQLGGKVEVRWRATGAAPLGAVTHAIGSTTTGGGAAGGGPNRSPQGAPNARTTIGGITRFEAEACGAGGATWTGGEPVNAEYPTGPVARVHARAPGPRSVLYVSMGTNDPLTGITGAQTLANLEWMIGRWTACGGSAGRFLLTTLAPLGDASHDAKVPALNAAIRELAARTGVRLIDLAAHVSNDDGLTWRSTTLHVGDRRHYAESVRGWLADEIVRHVGAAIAP